MSELQPDTAKSVEDVEKTPAGLVARWIAELDLADAAEETWRKEGETCWRIYESGDPQEGSTKKTFNILWANTETLVPAVYNSRPEPDVRRRFRDEDPVGKYAAQVLERALAYTIDSDDFDEAIKDVVLDCFVPGRGIARIKYEPKFTSMDASPAADPTQTANTDGASATMQGANPAGQPPIQPATSDEGEGLPEAPEDGDGHEAQQYEVIADESAPLEHVQWDDFRHGPGKRYADWPWIAFRHRLGYDALVKSFGEDIAKLIPLNDSGYENSDSKSNDETLKTFFKKAELWEIWDKTDKRVIFICKNMKEQSVKEVDDPLELQAFFPMPRPLVAIRNSRTSIPVPVYRLYKEQAEELELISARIKVITKALKVRGLYFSKFEEIKSLLDAGDNEMVPIQNAAALAGQKFEELVWILPIDELIKVLQGLYNARGECKQTIYEITGISDIIRGATQASETATAQQIKSKWGTIRLQRLQSEVQRFVKDLMRLMADLIGHQFKQETLAKMTGIQLPMQAQKDAAKQQLTQQQFAANQAAVVAQRSGQPPAPPQPPDPAVVQMLNTPSWEDVINLLRSDALRTCKVDVETDSTVQETIDQDMSGLAQVMGMIGQLITGAVPAVQSGMLTVEAVKDIAVGIARRARLGSVFEDALEEMKPPAPPPQAAPPPGMQQVAQSMGEMHGMVADLHSRMTGQPPKPPIQTPTSTPQLPTGRPSGVAA